MNNDFTQNSFNALKTNAERLSFIKRLHDYLFSDIRQPSAQYYGGEVVVGEARQTANDRAADLVGEFDANPSRQPTAVEKKLLTKFSGFGGGLVDKRTGKKGGANEYHPPKQIAEGIWEGLASLGFTGGKVLDPRAGAGIFGATAPLGCAVDAVEPNRTAGRVSQLVNDGAGFRTRITNFEKMASNSQDEIYDAVVAGVPSGGLAERGGNRMDDDRYCGEPNEVYYILRSLEKLKPNGLAAFIVSTDCVSGKGGKHEELRTKASYMAEFVGAYRLPSGTFTTASVEGETDIIFFRKFSGDTADTIARLREQNAALLAEAKVQWDVFISGKYFDGSEGKHYVLSDFDSDDPSKFRGADKFVTQSGLNDLREVMRRRRLPDSRIDWALLESAETTPIIYKDGDVIHQAGCTLVMYGGRWVQLPKSRADMEMAGLGAELATPYAAFDNSVTLERAEKYYAFYVNRGELDYVPDWLKSAKHAVDSSDSVSSRNDIWMKAVVALSVEQVISEHKGESLFNYRNSFAALSEMMQVFRITAKYGEGLGGNIRRAMETTARHYDVKRGFSEFWLGIEAKKDDGDNPQKAKLDLVRYKTKDRWMDIGQVREILGGDFDPFGDDGWCMSADGKKIISADDYYVGNYGDFISRIDADIEEAKKKGADGKIIEKLVRQKLNAEDRVGMANVERFRFDLRTPSELVTPEEKVKFLLSHVSRHAKVNVDQYGREYADIDNALATNTTDKILNRIGDYIRNGTITVGGIRFESDEDKRKGLTFLKDTITTAEEQFNTWCHSNKTIMDRVRAMAADPKRRRFRVTEDEDDLTIPGMKPTLKLHGYQCAFVRQMGRDFSGINGFGVGLGKTFTALASVQHAHSNGFKKRTLFVVPNSVLANWKSEVGHAYTSSEDCLFVGLRIGKDGRAVANSSKYAEDLAKVASGNYAKIFLTYEAFKAIRLKDETIDDYDMFMRANDSSYEIRNGVIETDEETGEETKSYGSKVDALLKQYNDKKNAKYPYLEEMGIDSIVIDEAHAFKNCSTSVEFKGARFLPLAQPSARGIDALIKTWYIRDKSPDSDGVLLLTATPITNSTLEIHSMLSLAVGEERLNASMLGCHSPDDFLSETCRVTQEANVTMDGFLKYENEFTGLKNVDVLRQSIQQGIVIKNAKDVGASVFIPERDVKSQSITLDDHSMKTLIDYKNAYRYAVEFQHGQTKSNEEILAPTSVYHMAFARLALKFHEDAHILGHPFNLIEKMSSVILDSELDEKATFYTVADDAETIALAKKVCDAFNKLNRHETRERPGPRTLETNYVEGKSIKDADTGKSKTLLDVTVYASVGKETFIANGETITAQRIVIDTTESKFIQDFETIADKFGLQLGVTCSPKLAALVENFNNEMAHPRGMISATEKSPVVKQIIFCDQMALHCKLKRLLTTKCGIPAGKIAIITGQTNNDPVELQDVSDGFNAHGGENRYQVIIANKKAEVGINLQKGTQAIHHLSIGWTPDSIEQRNGRGARQGNRTEKVTIYFYDAEGTFDVARRNMVNKKSEWIAQVLDKNGASDVTIEGMISKEQQEALIEGTGGKEDMERALNNLAEAERQKRIAANRRSQLSNIGMVISETNHLRKIETFDKVIEGNIARYIKRVAERGKARQDFEKEKEKYAKKRKEMPPVTAKMWNGKLANTDKQIASIERLMNQSAMWFCVDGNPYYESKENKYKVCEKGFAQYMSEARIKWDTKESRENPEETARDIMACWRVKYMPNKKGKPYADWQDEVAQANELIRQAKISYGEQSAQEGALSKEVINAAGRGGVIRGDQAFVVGGFIQELLGQIFVDSGGKEKRRLFVISSVDTEQGMLRLSYLDNYLASSYKTANFDKNVEFLLDAEEYKCIVPGTPEYEEALKDAAEREDCIGNNAEPRSSLDDMNVFTYSAVVPEVSRYRKTESRYWFKFTFILPAPYFPLVIPHELADRYPFLRPIHEKQKAVVKETKYEESWYSGISQSSYAFVPDETGRLPVFQKNMDSLYKIYDLFEEYHAVNGLTVPLREILANDDDDTIRKVFTDTDMLLENNNHKYHTQITQIGLKAKSLEEFDKAVIDMIENATGGLVDFSGVPMDKLKEEIVLEGRIYRTFEKEREQLEQRLSEERKLAEQTERSDSFIRVRLLNDEGEMYVDFVAGNHGKEIEVEDGIARIPTDLWEEIKEMAVQPEETFEVL